MTQKEERSWRINWTLDKILLGILGILMTWTAKSVQNAVDTVADLDKRTAIMEWRLQTIEQHLKIEWNAQK